MAVIIEDIELRNKNYVFKDRFHAGELLAQRLKSYTGISNAIILAIPSGGVPIGIIIAKKLGFLMDLIIVRKIPIPYNPEAGFGSISWDGDVVINEKLVNQLHLSDDEIDSAIQAVKIELNLRMAKFRGNKPFPKLKNKIAILVDDGLASGYTMLSAIDSIKKYSPSKIIVAVPTASKNAVELLSLHIDVLICLNIRETVMFAVADAYQEWHDLTDEEVIGILAHG